MRFRTRMVHQTICDDMEAHLVSLGWTTGSNDFQSLTLVFKEQSLDQINNITTNTLAISIGDVQDALPEEMGGGLYSVAVPIFFDVFCENQSTSISLADDIKAHIDRDQTLVVKDYSRDPAIDSSDLIQFQNVIGPIKPAIASTAVSTDFMRHWRIIKGLAVVYYVPD